MKPQRLWGNPLGFCCLLMRDGQPHWNVTESRSDLMWQLEGTFKTYSIFSFPPSLEAGHLQVHVPWQKENQSVGLLMGRAGQVTGDRKTRPHCFGNLSWVTPAAQLTQLTSREIPPQASLSWC